MHKGHIYILHYIKSLEDQLLVDNFPVGKELVKNHHIVENLIDELYFGKKMHESKVPYTMAYAEYHTLENTIAEQKYGVNRSEDGILM